MSKGRAKASSATGRSSRQAEVRFSTAGFRPVSVCTAEVRSGRRRAADHPVADGCVSTGSGHLLDGEAVIALVPRVPRAAHAPLARDLRNNDKGPDSVGLSSGLHAWHFSWSATLAH
ncbi:hypothetical protein C0216_05570 [Streptomyces globosus]|uniref:Uncharacterized protein n=1 Tax=Streptomyces globosus TaxID=68209 RepID=A0A344TWH0_9ACTN|nr:hypothetical protein C0216_05570 [Streptomyces globosus]